QDKSSTNEAERAICYSTVIGTLILGSAKHMRPLLLSTVASALSEKFAYRRGHDVELRVGQPGIDRQRHAALIVALGGGELAGREAEPAEVRLPVNRNIVDVDADVSGAHRVEEFAACQRRVFGETHDIEMPRRYACRRNFGQQQRQADERAVVAARDVVAPGDPVAEMPELRQAECRLHLGHAVVEAERLLLVIPSALAGVAQTRRIAGDAVAAKIGHACG